MDTKDKIKEMLWKYATDIQNSTQDVKTLNIVVLNGEIVVNNIEYWK